MTLTPGSSGMPLDVDQMTNLMKIIEQHSGESRGPGYGIRVPPHEEKQDLSQFPADNPSR